MKTFKFFRGAAAPPTPAIVLRISPPERCEAIFFPSGKKVVPLRRAEVQISTVWKRSPPSAGPETARASRPPSPPPCAGLAGLLPPPPAGLRGRDHPLC